MKIESEIKILGWYQMIGALLGLYFLIEYILPSEAFSGFTVLFILAIFILYLFSLSSGLILLKNPRKGTLLSRINQILQIIGFAVAGFGFQYISGLKLSVELDLTEEMLFKFGAAISSFQFDWNSDSEKGLIAINIVPMVVIHLLTNIENELKQEESSLEVTEEAF